MAKLIFFTMMFLAFIIVFVSIIIIQTRFNPGQDSPINRVGTRIIHFSTKNKKMLKKIASITISIVAIISLIFIVGSYIHTLPRNPKAENYINEYIRNSTEVELFYLEPDEMQAMRQESYENYTTEMFEKDIEIGKKYHKTQTIYTGMRFFGKRAKMKRVNFNTIVFKDENSQKYFQIMYASQGSGQMFIFDALLRDGLRLMASVNRFDLENTTFGTVEKPIPILMFRIPKYEGQEDYEKAKITEEQCKNSAYYYLAYIMSKEEFIQRFENSENDKSVLLTQENNAQTDSTNIKTYYYNNCSVDSITICYMNETHNHVINRKKDWDLILEIATTAIYDEIIDEAIGSEEEIDVPDFTFFIHCSNGQKHTIVFWGSLISIDGKWYEPAHFSSTEFQKMVSRYK